MASLSNHALWLMTANNPNLHLEATADVILDKVRRCKKLNGTAH